MQEDDEPYSMVLPEMPDRALDRAILWCRSRLGSELGESNPDGRWCWTMIPGLGTVLTMPSEEIICEMKLVQPWNP